MTEDELKQILSAGDIEEQIAELLRVQQDAEAAGAATRDFSPTVQAGPRTVVANIADPIAGIFERKRQKKTAEGAKAERDVLRKEREAIKKAVADGVMGRTLDPIAIGTPRVGTPPKVDIALQQAALAQPVKAAPGSMRPMPDRMPQGPTPNPSVPPPGARAPAPTPAPAPTAQTAPTPSPGLPMAGPVNPQAVIDQLRNGAPKRDQFGNLIEDEQFGLPRPRIGGY